MISDKAINLIIECETGGREYYNKFLSSPTYPGLNSGVTVGIGYDLGYNTREQITQDWSGKVNGNILSFMLSCSSLKGASAKLKVTPNVRGFKIDYDVAKSVFINASLPRYIKMTDTAYPKAKELNPDAYGAIVSLVFNRGTSFNGSTRKEMKELLPLINSAANAQTKICYKKIADKIREMKRLWDGYIDGTLSKSKSEVRITGLLIRRDKEADLIENSLTYSRP